MKHSGVFIEKSARIDSPCTIGKGTKIWHFSHVSCGARIGKNCILGQNVFIGKNVRIGDRAKIQNNVSIYEGVTLEDGVFCGPGMIFTNVKTPRAFISRKNAFEKTLVKKSVSIGAHATIVCGNTLGEFCMVGAGAVVTKDIPAHALVLGVPARQAGWVCSCGRRLAKNLKCLTCKKPYKKTKSGLKARPGRR